MKFKKPLLEAIFMKRNFRFLVEVVLPNRQKRMLYCSNLGPLFNCDVLGTRLWFSPANPGSGIYLDKLELAEVNGGALVAVSPDYAQVLVRGGIHIGAIPELQGYRFLRSLITPDMNRIESLMNERGEQCLLLIEPVFFGDDQGDGYLPEMVGHSLSELQELIIQRGVGSRTILIYLVQHTGVQCLRPADILSVYGKMLRSAMVAGVEVFAYRANISIKGLELGRRIPIVLSEDMVFR